MYNIGLTCELKLMGKRTQVQVRPFRKKDQGVALELQDEFIEEFFPEFVGDPRLHKWNADIYDIYGSYMEGDGNFWVVKKGSEVVGMGGIRISKGATPVLSRVRVRRSERGNGYGTLLLRYMEEYYLKQGYRKILVDTENHMVSAIKLYEGNGYFRIRETREEIDWKTYTSYFYEKNL
jgi:GNAT superfamily N-acetyltransferase